MEVEKHCVDCKHILPIAKFYPVTRDHCILCHAKRSLIRWREKKERMKNGKAFETNSKGTRIKRNEAGEVIEKECSGCGNMLTLAVFSANGDTSRSECRECISKKRKQKNGISIDDKPYKPRIGFEYKAIPKKETKTISPYSPLTEDDVKRNETGEIIAKKCLGTCQTVKPIENFSADERGLAGTVSKCGDCTATYTSTHYKKRKQEHEKDSFKFPETKYCINCDQTLPFTDFNTNPRNEDGLHSWCKVCKNKEHKQRYDEKHQYLIAEKKKAGECENKCGFTHSKSWVVLESAHVDREEKATWKDGTKKLIGALVLADMKDERTKVRFICRNCHRLETQLENEENYAQTSSAKRQRKYRSQFYEIANAEKLNRGCCMFCKWPVSKETLQMFDFDHINPETKVEGISQMCIESYDKQDIITEMTKCQLLCANCHFMKTLKDQTTSEVYQSALSV